MLGKHRSFGLLGSLALLVVVPIASAGRETTPLFEWLVIILFTMVFLTGLYAISSDRRMRTLGKILIAPVLIGQLVKPLIPGVWADVAGHISAVLALAFLLWGLVGHFLRAKRVTVDMLSRAISGYFLLGVMWALVFQLLIDFRPESFSRGGESMFYLSFVTLSTLGYGDVVPHTSLARAMTVSAALAGQLYLAIMVALLIGKLVASGSAEIRDE